jgi:hypothetical protein
MSITQIPVGQDVFRCEILRQGFNDGLDGWHEEGLGQFRLDGDSMVVDAHEGGYSAFCKQRLPADLLARFVVRTLPPAQQNNINLISHCQPPQPDTWPIVELGRYPGYRAMSNYIVTFVGAYEAEDWGKDLTAGRTRLRRNPDFRLIDETNRENRFGAWYEITFAAQGGRIRYYIDGRKIHDWQDPDPIGEGYFALRTFSTVLEYRDVLFARIV